MKRVGDFLKNLGVVDRRLRQPVGKAEVLAHDLERDLRKDPLLPWNIARILGGGLNENFAAALDERVFHGATFADLYRRGKTDFWINAVSPADVDKDGDLDLAVIGFYVVYNESVEDILVVFKNQGADESGNWTFTEERVPLDGVTAAVVVLTLAWFVRRGRRGLEQIP